MLCPREARHRAGKSLMKDNSAKEHQMASPDPTVAIYILTTLHESLWLVTRDGQLQTWADEKFLTTQGLAVDGNVTVVSGYQVGECFQRVDRRYTKLMFAPPPLRRLAQKLGKGALKRRPVTIARFAKNQVIDSVSVCVTTHPSTVMEMDGSLFAIMNDALLRDADFTVVVNSSTYVNACALRSELRALSESAGNLNAVIVGYGGTHEKIEFLGGWFRLFNRIAISELVHQSGMLEREYLEDVELGRLATRLGMTLVSYPKLWLTSRSPLHALDLSPTNLPIAIRCKDREGGIRDASVMLAVHRAIYGGHE